MIQSFSQFSLVLNSLHAERLAFRMRSCQLLQRRIRKHPDWKHNELAWFVPSRGHKGSVAINVCQSITFMRKASCADSKGYPPQPFDPGAIFQALQKYPATGPQNSS